MNSMPSTLDLEIDVSNALPMVGDRKRVEGAADVELREGYDMALEPGGAVSWSLDLRRIAGALEISGSVAGRVTLSCYRCLEEFTYDLALKLREHALWLNGREDDEDVETAPDYLVTDGMIDLEPVLRDAIALALPVRRVCDESCKGLCPRCGANLNTEPCSCPTKAPDARLSALAELKKKLEG